MSYSVDLERFFRRFSSEVKWFNVIQTKSRRCTFNIFACVLMKSKKQNISTEGCQNSKFSNYTQDKQHWWTHIWSLFIQRTRRKSKRIFMKQQFERKEALFLLTGGKRMELAAGKWHLGKHILWSLHKSFGAHQKMTVVKNFRKR